jgi:tRNA uridine 5-carboxymethylaminomethyl modification enzyme
MNNVIEKKSCVERIKRILTEISFEPIEVNSYLETINSSPISEKQKTGKLLLRPGVELNDLAQALPKLHNQLKSFSKENIEQASIQVKYEVYIEKEKELAIA